MSAAPTENFFVTLYKISVLRYQSLALPFTHIPV